MDVDNMITHFCWSEGHFVPVVRIPVQQWRDFAAGRSGNGDALICQRAALCVDHETCRLVDRKTFECVTLNAHFGCIDDVADEW